MSSNSTSASSETVSDEMIQDLRIGFSEAAAGFVLWGLHVAFASYASYLLCQRGLRRCLSRQCLLAMVLIMLMSSTAYVMLTLEFYMIQLPTLGGDMSDSVISQLVLYNIAMLWLTRLNFCLSDLIVVWRAWALWPGNRPVRWALGVLMTITASCTTANAIMITLQNIEVEHTASSSGPLYPPSALRSILYVPLIFTNVLATTLICYKAWIYRKDIRMFASNSGHFRVDRVLALFIETGALYVLLMLFNMLEGFGIFNKSARGHTFGIVWGDVMVEISGIYPTIIIILVSKYMSQSDIVYTSVQHTNDGSSPSDPKLDHEVIGDGARGVLSTIRFNAPETTHSMHSTNDASRNCTTSNASEEDHRGEKEADLECIP